MGFDTNNYPLTGTATFTQDTAATPYGIEVTVTSSNRVGIPVNLNTPL